MFHLLGTYVNILCNWLILWQNALYLYLSRSRMFLILQEIRFQDQVLKSSSLSKKTSWKYKFIKTWQLAGQLHLSSLRKLFQPNVLDSCSTSPICRGLRNSVFYSDFLRIRECVFGLSFFLTLDIYNDFFKSCQKVQKLHKHWTNSAQANCDRRRSSCLSSSLSLEEIVVYVHRRIL